MTKRPATYRHSIRIIGGRWRGRRLAIPRDAAVRPTPNRVRETVFNWLADRIANAACLDLYAGTGALGLEALSRGAREAWFVERDAALAVALRARIEALEAEATVLQTDVETLLLKPAPMRFDVVFLDPPYRESLTPLLAKLPPWLAPAAHIYVERARARGGSARLETLAAALRGATLVKRGTAGGIVFGLLRYERP